MIHVGVDLGLRGALVALDDDSRVVRATVVPVVGPQSKPIDYDVAKLVALIHDLVELAHAGRTTLNVTLEAPVARFRNGGWDSGTTALRESYGIWRTALSGHDLRLVPPITWQRKLLDGLRNHRSLESTKSRAIWLAKRLWPELELRPGRRTTDHDGLADAACIAEYGRRLVVRDGGGGAPVSPRPWQGPGVRK